MKRLSVNLPNELHAELRILAVVEESTLSCTILKVLRRYVRENKHKLIALENKRTALRTG